MVWCHAGRWVVQGAFMGGPMTGDYILAAAGIGAAGGLLQRKLRQVQHRIHRLLHQRSGPDRVPGNLFPAREIYFPGINIPIV